MSFNEIGFREFKKTLEKSEALDDSQIQEAVYQAILQYYKNHNLHLEAGDKRVQFIKLIKADTSYSHGEDGKDNRKITPSAVESYFNKLNQGESPDSFWPIVVYYWFLTIEKNGRSKDRTYLNLIENKLFHYSKGEKTYQGFFGHPVPGIKNQRLETVNGDDTWLSPRNPDIIKFEGRESELEKLNAFVKHDGNFKLWAIVGPSGAGKTRLMIHWANSAILDGWEALEISSKTKIEWSDWEPQYRTLIIIDYIYGYDQTIIDIVEAAKSRKFDHKVRLLILDHATPEKMADLLKDPRWGFDGVEASRFDLVASLFFDDAPLSLKEVPKDNKLLEKIICNITKKDGDEPTVVEALQYLADTTGAEQPLFAALVGDAIKNGNDYKARNRRELIRYYLQGKTRLTWQLNAPEGEWAGCFVAAATARNGMAFKTLMHAVPSEVKTRLQRDFPKFKSLCSGVTSSIEKNTLAPFQPDILGESHFLLFLKAIEDGLHDFDEHLSLLISADGSEPVEERTTEFSAFMTRLARNLLNDDQNDDDTKAYWRLLEGFMEPESFAKGSPFRWAVNIALFEVSEILKYAEPSNLNRAFYDKVIADELYALPADHADMRYFVAAIRYFGSISEVDSNVPTALQNLIKRYEQTDDKPSSSLFICSYFGFVSLAKFLIDQRTDVNVSDGDGWTALMTACQEGHMDTVALLIDNDADVNAVHKNNLTSLMFASHKGYAGIVALLIEHEANLNATDNDGWTALMIASYYDHMDIATLLVGHDIDLDAADCDGWTALMLASDNGHKDMADLLIKWGADINASGANGETALLLASQNNHTDVVAALVNNQVDIDATNNGGVTALLVASHNGHIDVVRNLLEADANVNASDNEGGTSLIFASEKGNIILATLLTDYDADTDLCKNDGSTALMFATHNNQKDIVALLIDSHADTNIINKNGLTALMLAVGQSNEDIVRLLLAVKTDVNSSVHLNDVEVNALAIARELGHEEIEKMLLNAGAKEPES